MEEGEKEDHSEARGDQRVDMAVLVILMTKLVIGGDFYRERYCKWSRMHSGTNY